MHIAPVYYALRIGLESAAIAMAPSKTLNALRFLTQRSYTVMLVRNTPSTFGGQEFRNSDAAVPSSTGGAVNPDSCSSCMRSEAAIKRIKI